MVYTKPYNIEGLIYHPSLDVEYGKNLGEKKGELEDSVVNFVRKKFKVLSNVKEVLILLGQSMVGVPKMIVSF
jgi:hypothetical protein